jgi:glycine dehydrogenase subunit 2
VRGDLERFLPSPRVAFENGRFVWRTELPDSIGKVRAFHGNFAVLVRAYAYILRNGGDGLEAASERAVLNSNYLCEKVKQGLEVPFDGPRKHEFVASARKQAKEKGVRALDIAKRLLDEGMMAPTIYFPMLVEEALMIEPTETESKETLDEFADALLRICSEEAAAVKAAPMNTASARIDELYAAKELILTWKIYEAKAGK